MSDYSVDLDVLRQALFERSLSQVGDNLLKVAITSPVRIGRISLQPAADLAVRVLNRPDDKDDDGVFSTAAGSHIAHRVEAAWLKFKISLRAAESVALAHPSLRATRGLELADYRLHAAGEPAWKALLQDLESPRTILELDDVRKLQPGEALTLETAGDISLTFDLSWADAIATRLTEILAGFPRPIALTLDKAAAFTATARVSDDFAVIVSRTPTGDLRFTVNKSAVNRRQHSFVLSFGADANAVPAVEEVLEPIFQAVNQAAPLEVDAAAKIKQELRVRLERIARWKAEVALTYEYARIEESSSIVDYILHDEQWLASDHRRVLDGDFVAISEEVRRSVGARTLLRYLNESSLTRRWSAGFSLGLRKWIDVRAKDESAFRQTVRTSPDEFRLITCRGTRRYDENQIPENDFEWLVDFNAPMRDYMNQPSSVDFEYGIHYAVILERAALSVHDLDRMLDFAAMWDIRVPGAAEFAPALGRKSAIRVQLVLDGDTLRRVVAASVATAPGSWAGPLAAAMPYMSTFSERSTHGARRELYQNAWAAWLSGDPGEANVRGGLRLLEERRLPGSFAWTVGHGHPQLRQRLEAFLRGVQRLHDCMEHNQSPAAIGEAYESLQQLWSQRLYIAASGRFLLDRAREAAVEVNRSFQVDFGEKTTLA